MSTVSYGCRFCLKQMQPNEKMAFIDDEIKDQFVNVTQIWLELNDGLSQIVCEICLRSVQLSHAMKMQFVENQRKLLAEIRSVAQSNALKDLSIVTRPIDEVPKLCYKDPEPPNKKRKRSIQESSSESSIKIKLEKIDAIYNNQDSNQEENDSNNLDNPLNICEEMDLKIKAEESFAENEEKMSEKILKKDKTEVSANIEAVMEKEKPATSMKDFIVSYYQQNLIFSMGTNKILKRDFLTLAPNKWLSGNAIIVILKCLSNLFCTQELGVVDCYTMSESMRYNELKKNKYVEQSLLDVLKKKLHIYSKNIDLLNKKLFFPTSFFNQNHWITVTLQFVEKIGDEFIFLSEQYDSMNSVGYRKDVHDAMSEIIKIKVGDKFKLNSSLADSPKQSALQDCGLFSIKMIENHLMRKSVHSFDKSQVLDARKFYFDLLKSQVPEEKRHLVPDVNFVSE